jgi:hypothetical protein
LPEDPKALLSHPATKIKKMNTLVISLGCIFEYGMLITRMRLGCENLFMLHAKKFQGLFC